MPSSAPATIPSDLLVRVWLEPRTAAVTRLVAETVKAKAFRKNISIFDGVAIHGRSCFDVWKRGCAVGMLTSGDFRKSSG